MRAPVRARVGVRVRPWRAARLLLAALLVPLDEDVLLEQVDVVQGLEQIGRLAQERRGVRRVGDELLHALEHELLRLLLIARRLEELRQHGLVRAHLLERVGVEHALEDEAEEVVAPAQRPRARCTAGAAAEAAEAAERSVAGTAAARAGVAARRRRGAAHCSSCSLATAMSALTASAVSSLSMASLILRPMARFSSSNSSSSSSPSRSPLAFSTCGRQSSSG